MNLTQFLLALRARSAVFAMLLAATVIAGTLASLLMPKSYKAMVSLLVDAKDEQSLNNPLRPLVLPQERLNYMQTQMDILNSRKVASKVVQDLRLAENASVREALEREAGSAGPIEDRLAESLLKNLKVETSQSNVIQASFTSSDPRYAATVANAFAKSYIDTMLELRVEPTREAAVWFNEQLKTLRANLEEAQSKLTQYHQQQGIVSSDERFDDETTRLGVLAEQVARGQEQTYGWNSRAQLARRYMDKGGAPERLPEVLDNVFVQRLKADLLHGEARLQDLSAQYGPNHPNYERQLLENRNEFTVLKRNVESAERAYDTAMQRFVVSQVDSRASQTNVTVLNPAVVPSTPSRPRVLLNIVLSAVIGTMLAIGAVVFMEIQDRRVRSGNDLALAPNLPLLAVLGERSAFERLLGAPNPGPRALPAAGG